MLNIPYPPQRPLSVGEILDLTFRIFRATLGKCLLFAGLGVIASQIPNLYSLARGRGLLAQSFFGQLRDPLFWLMYVAGTILVLAFYAAVLLRQHAMLTDRPIGGEFLTGLGRAPRWLLLSLLVALACGACFLPAVVFSGAARWVLLTLMLIPISYVLVASSSAWVILIVDRSGAVGSFQRSWHLTSGSFWRLSAIYSVALVVLLVLYFLLAALAAFIAALVGRGDVAVVAATTSVIVVALGALVTPFYTALGLAVFGDLSVRKEGADLAQRISAT
jgi:hypothetical protein